MTKKQPKSNTPQYIYENVKDKRGKNPNSIKALENGRRKGKTAWNKGLKGIRKETRLKMRLAKLGKPSAKKGKKYSDYENKINRIPESIRKKIFEKYGWRCAKCGSTKKLCIDHIYPRSKGGSDEISNFQVLCHRCNSGKCNRTTLSFREMVQGHKYIFYHVFCKKVIDGDSVIVDIDLGFKLWIKDARLRLARINTPEIRTKNLEEKRRGLIAKQSLKNLIEKEQIIIETIKMPKDKQPIDSFGRYLVEVYDLGGTNINDFLVESQVAKYQKY